MRWLLIVALILSSNACVGETVNDIQLDIDPRGFACFEELPDGTNQPLILRAYDGPSETGELNVVVDYLRFDGVPSCLPTVLLDTCVGSGCPIVRRNCISLDAAAVAANVAAPFDVDDAVTAVRQELLEQQPIATRDAPNGVVAIRVVATTESCDVLAPPDGSFGALSCSQLLGCGYSCPAQLDEVRGEVDITIGILSPQCTTVEVELCAGIGRDDLVVEEPVTWCAR
jgi:hypothetical protein